MMSVRLPDGIDCDRLIRLMTKPDEGVVARGVAKSGTSGYDDGTR